MMRYLGLVAALVLSLVIAVAQTTINGSRVVEGNFEVNGILEATIPSFLEFPACSNQAATAGRGFDLPSSNAPEGSALSNTILTCELLFDQSTDESIQLGWWLPGSPSSTIWNSGDITIDVWWRSSATTNTVTWAAQGVCIPLSSSITSPTFNTAQIATDDADGTANDINIATITMTAAGTLSGCDPGEHLRIRFFRDANQSEASADDDLAADAGLWKIVVTMRLRKQ